MAGPIARRPNGLLDLLLAQQQGKNPATLGDSVVPVIDLGPFYNSERVSMARTTGTYTVSGGAVTLSIPTGEAWKVLAISCNGSFSAVAQRMAMNAQIVNIPGGSAGVGPTWKLCDVTSVAATDTFGGAACLDDWILLGGVQFRFICSIIDLAAQPNIPAAVTVTYVRMEM